jgi:hypothetical protein
MLCARKYAWALYSHAGGQEFLPLLEPEFSRKQAHEIYIEQSDSKQHFHTQILSHYSY